MATVLGTVITISLETDVAKNGGGTYKGWELVYKSQDGQVRTIAKPVQSLRFAAALKNALASLEAGDKFTLIQEKSEKTGFNEVKSVTKGWDEAAPAPSRADGPPASKAAAPANSYTQRDYETKDERTVKQRLIVRQSSVSSAIAILSLGAKSLKKEDVFELAQEITNFVYEATPRQLAENALAEMEDDIPY